MAILWILLATLAVSAVIALVIVRRNRRRAEQRLAEVGGPVQRSTAATSLGQASDERPVRGTGSLVLTDSEVAFAYWQPDRLVRIARAAIIEVDTTRSHLGKTMNNDLLRIRWSTADPEGDSIALFVRDLDPWLTDLGGTRTPESDDAS
jgi:hypothetical protein